jgi:hypothetical protein
MIDFEKERVEISAQLQQTEQQMSALSIQRERLTGALILLEKLQNPSSEEKTEPEE